MLLNNLWFYLS